MSGGSFNYVADRATADLLIDDRDLVAVRDVLARYPDSERAVARVDAILCMLAAVRRTVATIDLLRAEVYDVLHAVEWHHSADVGEDAVARALAALNGPKPT